MTAGGPNSAHLGAGRRNFRHGPIDLLIEVEGDRAASERALERCWQRFQTLLGELVAELGMLRLPAERATAVRGPVAQRMLRACAPFAAERFITPMAAVAGAVADELITLLRGAGIRRACVNNGGDIALHLAPGEIYRVGIGSPTALLGAAAPAKRLEGAFAVNHGMPVGGIATSGWRGRSFSLGVADSVTVLADCAAAADAAATLIANAVDCDHPGVVRRPADELKDDTDLGARLVTVSVPSLPACDVTAALARGRAEADRWRARGLIHAAALLLQGAVEVIGPIDSVAGRERRLA